MIRPGRFPRPRPLLLPVALVLAGSLAAFATAQEPPKHTTAIDVIGVTPVDGIGLERAKFPTNAQRIARTEGTDAAESLVSGSAAMEANDPQGGLLQLDLQFRGFSVSPLLGAPEGLAFFQDGVRLNEPFGDTIAWSTIPSAAHVRDGGWRDFSPSDVTQLFASTKWSSGDLRLTLARSTLTGNGAVPEELLAADRPAVFTHPDETRNGMAMLSTRQQRVLSELLFAEATGYVRRTRTRTFNGDDSPFEPCEDAQSLGLLCLEDEIVRDLGGVPVAIGGEAFDATNNRTRLAQTAFGAGMQLDRNGTIRRRSNRVIAGASLDGGVAQFESSTELAELTAQRGTIGKGIISADSLVELSTRSTTLSAFVADIFAATPRLTVTATARLNHVRMRLDDRIGTDLDGAHSFTQLHPSIGAAYELSPRASAFANIGVTGRTPTPVELSCADPEDPCRLPNAFVSDPPLRAVTGRTIEAGLRGAMRATNWSAAAHRSVSKDDLMFISSGPLRGEGHFANVGTTRRQGLELAADGRAGADGTWSASYAFLDATFVTPFTIAAPNHPDAIDGEIEVESGDRLPLVPRHVAKLSASVELTPRFRAGATARGVASQFFRGDEANLAEPLPSYVALDGRLDVRAGNRSTVTLEIRNVFDAEYATFGVFGDAEDVLGEEYEDSRRFVTPAAPRSFGVSVRTRF